MQWWPGQWWQGKQQRSYYNSLTKKKGRVTGSYPEIPFEFLPVSQLCGRHLSIQEVASWLRIKQRCSSHVRPCAPITDLNKCIVSSTWTCMKLFLWSISAPICGKQKDGCLSIFLEIHTYFQFTLSTSLPSQITPYAPTIYFLASPLGFLASALLTPQCHQLFTKQQAVLVGLN